MDGVARFFSTDARVNSARLALVLALAAGMLRLTIGAFQEGDTLAYIATGALWGALLAKVFAEAGRRLHDIGMRGRAGWWPAVALPLYGWSSIGDAPWLTRIAGAGALLSVALFFVRGQLVRNAWGERPSWFAIGEGATWTGSRRALAWATVSIAGGALIGFALISISHGMAEANRRNYEWAQAHSPPA